MKSKGMSEAAFLALLQKVLPKATRDPHLASSIYDQVAKEFHFAKSLERFETFCAEGSLPNLEPNTVAELQSQLSESFGDAKVAVTPDEKGESVALEIVLPDRTITNKLKVLPPGAEPEPEQKPKFVPFPVALPEDPDLLWILARREDFPPEDAARSLASIEEEFWATKAGQKAQRDRVERTFAEFVQRVPAAMLVESGLKRHYKEPEPRKLLQRLPPSSSPAKAG
ncbi:MAG TPA: hypothetical protein VMF06_04160 [Candidatus Limnocylindria bacterium]|jgi:hypothetical protein|nr:hypothetical protein [Candidatus Limnocylindria bacterium]